MRDVMNSFFRAMAHCVHPTVIFWSLLPLVLTAGLALGLGWLYWERAVDAVRQGLEGWALLDAVLQWLSSVGGDHLRAMVAPLIVVALAVPAVVLVTLLLVAWTLTPALVGWVARRRFPGLERRPEAAAWWRGLAWSLGCTALALVMLVVTLPLWLFPPLALVLPPLIWGWLAARVYGFDCLSVHASATERRYLMRRERWWLLLLGVVSGLLGSLPSLLWALSAVTLIFAPVLIVASVWLYTLVFAFASLWFTHFLLARLEQLRSQRRGSDLQVEAT